MRVAIRVPVGLPLPDLAAFISRCEDAGFDGVGIHDHPSSGRDAYLALALAARATRRLQLFPTTSSPLVRHPLVLAALANSLDEIAPGRICLTIAPGFDAPGLILVGCHCEPRERAAKQSRSRMRTYDRDCFVPAFRRRPRNDRSLSRHGMRLRQWLSFASILRADDG